MATLTAYRPAKSLPLELRETCVIYFEELLYSQALQLLHRLLVANTSSEGSPLPAFTPPPHFLSLAATLSVHPTLTTRTTTASKHQAASQSLSLLRHTLALVGPVNARLDLAFVFACSQRNHAVEREARRLGRSQAGSTTASGAATPTHSDPSPSDEDTIRGKLANAGSLWNKADSFWHVVGWAFNCSVLYPRRWQRWAAWLEFMIDALEADWTERVRLVERGEGDARVLRDSLALQYLADAGPSASRTARRKVMRAIFADGGEKAAREFGEVFHGETAQPKDPKTATSTRRPARARVNIDEGEFGDYALDDDEDDDSSEAASPPHPHPTPASPPARALTLRIRLLSLLCTLSTASPQLFTSLEDLLDLYTEFIRPLPLPLFAALVSPSSLFPSHILTLLHRMLLRPLLAATAPPYTPDPASQEALQTAFLPHAAASSGVSDNARASLVLEGLLRATTGSAGAALQAGRGFADAVAVGVAARRRKAGEASGRRGRGRARDEDDADARAWFEGSCRRLEIFADAVEGGSRVGA